MGFIVFQRSTCREKKRRGKLLVKRDWARWRENERNEQKVRR